jgi:uncharacterized membrane protein
MTVGPPPTLYHRWMGWHAPALRRVAILALFGLAVVLVLLPILPWQPAVVAGWDAAGALSLAGRESGPGRILLIGLAVMTVLVSWTVLNTVYTLHYAHRDLGSTAPGIAFGDAAGQQRPTYRDFAYVAFTIGMTYQVSDTTVHDPRIRRAVLSHALLSYLFGVVIIGGSVNSSPDCFADPSATRS